LSSVSKLIEILLNFSLSNDKSISSKAVASIFLIFNDNLKHMDALRLLVSVSGAIERCNPENFKAVSTIITLIPKILNLIARRHDERALDESDVKDIVKEISIQGILVYLDDHNFQNKVEFIAVLETIQRLNLRVFDGIFKEFEELGQLLKFNKIAKLSNLIIYSCLQSNIKEIYKILKI
jgi:hypothetical protein